MKPIEERRISRLAPVIAIGASLLALVLLIIAAGVDPADLRNFSLGAITRQTPTPTPTNQARSTLAIKIATATPTAAPTATATPTATPKPTATATPTPSPTATPVPTPAPGAVWAVGYNSHGEVGDGTTDERKSYVPSLVTNATAISASQGWQNSAALKSDGTVLVWGSNLTNQLSPLNTPEFPTPFELSNLSGSVQIVANRYDQYGLKKDGTVWDIYGQMNGLTGIKQIAAGDSTFIALGSDGTVYDKSGNAIDGASPAIAVAAGSDHLLVLKADGTVWAWGGNGDFGQCGVDPQVATTVVEKPTQVAGVSGIVAITTTWRQSMALKSDGTVWMWGRNDNGQLGDGSATPAQYRYQPGPVVNLTGVIAISGARYHSMALKSDGTVWVWGGNLFDTIGITDVFQTTTPMQLKLPDSATAKVVGIAAGVNHSLILYGPK